MRTSPTMTTSPRPAAVARTLTGAGTAIALIGMVTGFQVSAAVAEQQAQGEAQAQAAVDAAATGSHTRSFAARVLDPSLLPTPEPVAPRPAPPAPRAAAPAPAPAPAPADGSTGGSGG